jgi:murein DD-endopeptidase MepM/ murein hydrolase activator NlpD
MKPILSYPVNNPVITQIFGANPQFYSDPKYGGIIGHNGIDFYAEHGTPVYATHDGLAQYEIDDNSGHGVVIFNNAGFKTIYWHFCDSKKEPQYKSPCENGNIQVNNGDLIGYADNTGASTGDHLHFGLKFCEKGEDTGAWYNLNQKNGYNGALNPLPYFDKSTPYQISILKKEVGILSTIIALLKKLLALALT